MNASLLPDRFKPHPEWLLRFYDAQGFIVPPISVACCVLLITVVVRCSPRAMGAFKWYIIASSLGSLFCELLVGFGHPLPLFPYPLALGGGLLPWLNLPPEGNNVYVGTICLSFLVMMYCNASMCAFRFGQTVGSSWIKLMAVPKYAFGLAVSFIGVFAVGMMLPLTSSLAPIEETRQIAKLADPALYAVIKDQPFIGFQKIEVNGWFFMLLVSAILFFGPLIFAMVGSAVGCQYALRSSLRQRLSEHTLRLYRILANTLVLELVLSFVTLVIPGIVMVASFLLKLEHANTFSVLMLCVIELYPIATNILILSYVKPYRRGVLQFMRRYGRLNAEPSSFTTVKPRIK